MVHGSGGSGGRSCFTDAKVTTPWHFMVHDISLKVVII